MSIFYHTNLVSTVDFFEYFNGDKALIGVFRNVYIIIMHKGTYGYKCITGIKQIHRQALDTFIV